MIRYVAHPRGWVENWDNGILPSVPTVTVWEADTSPQSTGLVDMHGDPVFRVTDKPVIGFQIRSAK